MTGDTGESGAMVPGPGVHVHNQRHVGPVRLEAGNLVLTVVGQVLLAPLLGQVVPGDDGGRPVPHRLTQQDDPVSTDQILPVQLGHDDGGDGAQVDVYLHAGHEGSGVQGKVCYLTDHFLVEVDGAGDSAVQ